MCGFSFSTPHRSGALGSDRFTPPSSRTVPRFALALLAFGRAGPRHVVSGHPFRRAPFLRNDLEGCVDSQPFDSGGHTNEHTYRMVARHYVRGPAICPRTRPYAYASGSRPNPRTSSAPEFPPTAHLPRTTTMPTQTLPHTTATPSLQASPHLRHYISIPRTLCSRHGWPG